MKDVSSVLNMGMDCPESVVGLDPAIQIHMSSAPPADETLKAETELRQVKYLNNVIEQDHRNVKQIVKPMMGFQSFKTARRTLRGIEAMAMIRKGQVKGVNQATVLIVNS